MHGLPDDSLDHQRAFYPPQVVQFHAARERMKHREMLQREAERLDTALVRKLLAPAALELATKRSTSLSVSLYDL